MTVKPDEMQLWAAFSNDGAYGHPDAVELYGHRWPRDAAKSIQMHPKRCLYLCDKWTERGWYEYGVSADLGWKTGDGHPTLKK